MRLSPNTRYAVRVLFELEGLPEALSRAELAEKTGMTLRAVEDIHTILRNAGITAGTVGAKGGIRLLVPLQHISLGQLILLFDGGVDFAVCCGDKSNECPNQSTCVTRSVWRVVSQTVQTQLNAISMASIFQQYPKGSADTVLRSLTFEKGEKCPCEPCDVKIE